MKLTIGELGIDCIQEFDQPSYLWVKQTTILPLTHGHVLIQSVHGQEGLFTGGSVIICMGETKSGLRRSCANCCSARSSTMKEHFTNFK